MMQCNFFTDGSCMYPAYNTFTLRWRSFTDHTPMCAGHIEIIREEFLAEVCGERFEDVPDLFIVICDN